MYRIAVFAKMLDVVVFQSASFTIVAVLFAENAAFLSVLPEEAVPAICRAGSMVANAVHRDGQNFFHR